MSWSVAVDLELTTKDNCFVRRLNILILIYAFSFVFLRTSDTALAQSGAACTGTSCGGPGGTSSCSAGFACLGGHCNYSPFNCVDNSGGGDPCTGSGCGGSGSSCPLGFACLGNKCSASPNCQTAPPNPGEGYSGENAACTQPGCGDPICGAGYSCDDGICVQNSSCVGSIVPIPYTGPKIDSLGALIGRIYNILFPAALLIGIIMIIKGGYELMTSEGNPQLARVGQEDLTAAVMGTIFVVMAGLTLRMIIVQVLGGSVGF